MYRFKKILVVADPMSSAEPIVARAIHLAQTNKARLTVACVCREPESTPVSIRDAIRREQKKYLTSLVQKDLVKDVKVNTKGLVGIPFMEIIREVLTGKYDLLMKPAEGRGGLSRLLFGSTDLNLLRKCPCPVWIMKPSQRKQFSRVLAAVDPDPGIEANPELNKLIMDLATSLAARENSELHIVHAWSVPYERLMRSGRARVSTAYVKRFVRETRIAHKTWLDELTAEYDLAELGAKVHLLKGDPGDVIPALAKKKRVELVVIGTVARTGIPGFLIGNTAENTLAELDCSVLAVKPKAFRTTIRV